MNYCEIDFIIINTLLLIVWFKTDGFIEYSKVFGISKWLNVDDFEDKKNNDFELTYHSYLRQYHNSFWIRLVTCPICISCWLLLPLLIISGIGNYSFCVVISTFLYYLYVKTMK